MRHNVQCEHAAILLYIFLLSSISMRESTNCQDARRVKRKIPMKITHSFFELSQKGCNGNPPDRTIDLNKRIWLRILYLYV